MKTGGGIENPGTRKGIGGNDELRFIKFRKDLSQCESLFGHQFRERFQHL